MNVEQHQWRRNGEERPTFSGQLQHTAQLVLAFGPTSLLQRPEYFESIQDAYPNAHVLGCSTAGEIYDTEVSDDALTVTAAHFEHTTLRSTSLNLSEVSSSYEAGQRLAAALNADDLAHVFVLSDGLAVNGSELVNGLVEQLPDRVAVTGGLAGDGDRFNETFVCADTPPAKGHVGAVGFYGDRLRVGYGSVGGWDTFGPDRLITRSEGNVLYELDHQSALSLYKRYLGEYAADLPASALLFPLSLRVDGNDSEVVRTVLAVDDEAKSMTFAGDVPQGAYGRFMKANFERLIDGAAQAAATSNGGLRDSAPSLAVLISCVGRKLVLKQRVEEEVESVRDILGGTPLLTGFYSYGEISPHTPSARCELHNQTMTITTFSEV